MTRPNAPASGQKRVKRGDSVKIVGQRGWWKVFGKYRGWLRLSQDKGLDDEVISALESTVTEVRRASGQNRGTG